MNANGKRIGSPRMVVRVATTFRGWIVDTKFGPATVTDNGDHFAVRVPVRLNWGCHWKDGQRYGPKHREGVLTREPITYLVYRAAVSMTPLSAVRFALASGTPEVK